MNNQRYNSENTVKDNSRRILYVTVIIAALFVAVISGTFAYFTASATNNTTVQGTIANTSLTLAVTKLNYPTNATNGPNLIPMDTTAYSNLNTALAHGCVDSNGYTACQVYRIAVTLPTNSPRLAITGTVNIAANSDSAIPNLTYTILGAQTTGTNTTVMTSLTTTATYYAPRKTLGQGLVFTDIENATNGYLAATTTSEVTYNYYLIVWVEDILAVQNKSATAYPYDSKGCLSNGKLSGDSSVSCTYNSGDNYKGDYGSFTGTVTIQSANGNITATFS